ADAEFPDNPAAASPARADVATSRRTDAGSNHPTDSAEASAASSPEASARPAATCRSVLEACSSRAAAAAVANLAVVRLLQRRDPPALLRWLGRDRRHDSDCRYAARTVRNLGYHRRGRDGRALDPRPRPRRGPG